MKVIRQARPGRLLVLITASILLAAAGGAAATDKKAPEVWESSFLKYRAVAYMEEEDGKVWGVLYFHQPFGKMDTYHFTGTVKDGHIEASHYTGHHFEGTMVNEDEVVGVVTHRRGYSMKVTAHRRYE